MKTIREKNMKSQRKSCDKKNKKQSKTHKPVNEKQNHIIVIKINRVQSWP